jgi:hypothetical protein
MVLQDAWKYALRKNRAKKICWSFPVSSAIMIFCSLRLPGFMEIGAMVLGAPRRDSHRLTVWPTLEPVHSSGVTDTFEQGQYSRQSCIAAVLSDKYGRTFDFSSNQIERSNSFSFRPLLSDERLEFDLSTPPQAIPRNGCLS